MQCTTNITNVLHKYSKYIQILIVILKYYDLPPQLSLDIAHKDVQNLDYLLILLLNIYSNFRMSYKMSDKMSFLFTCSQEFFTD